jgi:hypothetical protein
MLNKAALLLVRLHCEGDFERFNRVCNRLYEFLGKHVYREVLSRYVTLYYGRED